MALVDGARGVDAEFGHWLVGCGGVFFWAVVVVGLVMLGVGDRGSSPWGDIYVLREGWRGDGMARNCREWRNGGNRDVLGCG